jgi:hypothetical protein
MQKTFQTFKLSNSNRFSIPQARRTVESPAKLRFHRDASEGLDSLKRFRYDI